MEKVTRKEADSVLANRFVFYLTLHALICAALLLGRTTLNHYFGFRFLTWNLFLAWLPLLFVCMAAFAEQKNIKILVYPLLALWLLFLPNSFYIITDLIHLKHRSPVPLWYDVILLFSFALNGCLVGMYSLLETQKLTQRLHRRNVNGFIMLSLFILVGFGIYLGRFSRWNSWDLFNRPEDLFHDIVIRVVHPFQYAWTWVFTLITGVSLWVFYQMLRTLKLRSNSD